MYVMQYGLKSYKNISIIPFIFEIENEEIPNDLYAIALILERRKNSGPNTVRHYIITFSEISPKPYFLQQNYTFQMKYK